MKYKRAKKHHSVLIITCIIISIFIFMGTGYAMYTGSLKIGGYAVLLPNADNRPIVSVNDTFAIVSNSTDRYASFNLSDGSVTITSESITEDGITVNYQINIKTGTPRTETISFDIMNITDSQITNGTFSYTLTPSTTTVINGAITANIPQTIEPHAIRSHKNKYTS